MDINTMTVEEFREGGYLQEVNRNFLHRLGLALSVTVDEEGNVLGFGPIWDYREDPEGLLYAEDVIDNPKSRAKANKINKELYDKDEFRKESLGFVLQPI